MARTWARRRPALEMLLMEMLGALASLVSFTGLGGVQPLTGWEAWLRALTLPEKGSTTLVKASLEESAQHC